MRKKILRILSTPFAPITRIWNYLNWKLYLSYTDEIWLVVGAQFTYYKGWFSTDRTVLDVTKAADFEKYFKEKKISRILAEHVLEHLSNVDIREMVKNFADYMLPGARIRVAVPDGNHADPAYIAQVKPGGSGMSAEEHQHLFTQKSLVEYFENSGFSPVFLEYWDEEKQFHSVYENDEFGYIRRSLLNDPRNKNGKPVYTSLIIDFIKL